MDLTQVLPFAIFGGFTFLAWFVMNQMGSRNTRANERLDELRNPALRNKETATAPASGNGVSRMFVKSAPAISKALVPKTELEQSALKVRLANAGFNSPTASSIFLAIKMLSLTIGCIAGGGYGIYQYGITQNGIVSTVLGAGAGFYIPELALVLMIKSRKEKIFLSLPDALDLLVVCVEAGLGLDAGMRRVSEELDDTAPELCREFSMCNFQLQIGRPRREVLHDLGIRSGVDDLKALAAILIQADRFGSSVAQALRVQSESMRVKRRQMAEEKAQKTAVQMIFPLVLFIFPGIFVVLVGPAAIMMINQLLTTN